jgi:hypothetical protein
MYSIGTSQSFPWRGEYETEGAIADERMDGDVVFRRSVGEKNAQRMRCVTITRMRFAMWNGTWKESCEGEILCSGGRLVIRREFGERQWRTSPISRS